MLPRRRTRQIVWACRCDLTNVVTATFRSIKTPRQRLRPPARPGVCASYRSVDIGG